MPAFIIFSIVFVSELEGPIEQIIFVLFITFSFYNVFVLAGFSVLNGVQKNHLVIFIIVAIYQKNSKFLVFFS
jgi:hypothetical protein